MNAMVIGYGSIGSRHARILKEMGVKTTVVSARDIDFKPSDKTLSEAFKRKRFDYVVVANETVKHFQTLCDLAHHGYGGIVLVEKPLFFKPERKHFALKKIFTAYNLRFHPLIRGLKEFLKNEKPVSVQCYVGKYLPYWRPERDYRKSYSAIKSAGGGVLRDLSHELDYLTWIFGSWKRVVAMGGRMSHLEIDSDDCYGLLLSTKKCPLITVQLNYLDKKSRREIIVNTNAHTFRADLISGVLEIDGNLRECFSVRRDDTYRMEHAAIMKKRFDNLCTFEQGLDTMDLIVAAEESSRLKKWVRR